MTASTLTLVDFLLTRIAEDEAAIRSDLKMHDTFTLAPDRMLAECEAKRRIVGMGQEVERRNGRAAFNYELGGWFDAFDNVLRLLALPYVDHADYDESWRP